MSIHEDFELALRAKGRILDDPNATPAQKAEARGLRFDMASEMVRRTEPDCFAKLEKLLG